MRLVYVGNWYGAHEPFKALFKEVTRWDTNVELSDNDVVLFGGGSDISPTIYNKICNPVTGATNKLSNRDEIEVEVFKQGSKAGSKFVGICRGAQLLCALSGGYLVQHVDNHASLEGHDILTNDGRVMNVSSSHHQMMVPFDVPHDNGC